VSHETELNITVTGGQSTGKSTMLRAIKKFLVEKGLHVSPIIEDIGVEAIVVTGNMLLVNTPPKKEEGNATS
jgi:polynucleotide 5'-kinase involved in rRNA processing